MTMIYAVHDYKPHESLTGLERAQLHNKIHEELLIGGFTWCFHEEDFEDVGAPDEGPRVVGHPAFHEYTSDRWRIITQDGAIVHRELRDTAFEAFVEEQRILTTEWKMRYPGNDPENGPACWHYRDEYQGKWKEGSSPLPFDDEAEAFYEMSSKEKDRGQRMVDRGD